ncbi:phage GP46 family protein [Pseudogulbenkiania ferrooxidans]|uniref:GP46 family protein n=1 Tax=Pseudogulbenkiania ferrooxidans 2002 TaxID=279714 RepID=B9YYV6_9NEIS|nr:phage GP46 family protein [Pseudogulbenkiania ferrooxidans]EEG10309.1 GP46 family protein [Pseudogulbenkiania ferrooxidans 2002]
MEILVQLDGKPLAASHAYARAMAISLFTWRRAEAGDPVDDDWQGWWAEGLDASLPAGIGSRLWLLQRRRLDADAQRDAHDYTREALQWWLDSKLASAVEVTVSRLGDDGLAIRVEITLRSGKTLTADLSDIWSLTHGV